MKRTLIITFIAISITIAICALIGTSHIKPKANTIISTRILKLDNPISTEKKISSEDFHQIILGKLPKSSRVDYEESISVIRVIYDESVKSQFFITYQYRTYKDSWSQLFFDAPAHNYVLRSAIEDSILQLYQSLRVANRSASNLTK